MHSQKFVLKKSEPAKKRSYKSLILASSLVIVGTVAAAAMLFHLPNEGSNIQSLFTENTSYSEEQFAFMQFVAQYGKTYGTKSDINSRFEIFAENFRRMKAHNSHSTTYQMGINKFSDLSLEEFEVLYHKNGLAIPKVREERKMRLQSALVDSSEPAPEKADWREAGKLTPSQDQASCGACWAFTTTSTIESMIAIKNDAAPIALSVQHLMDCDEVNFGCGGGWMLDAYEFSKSQGLIKESDYPMTYRPSKGSCQQVSNVERFRNTDQKEEDNISNDRLKKLVSIRPVGIAMHSNAKCLMGYQSGILTEKDCRCSFEKDGMVNHAVTMVGYGSVENNKDCEGYWLIKNSWGPHWGDAGLFKLCIPHPDKDGLPTGTCQVKSYVQYPLLN